MQSGLRGIMLMSMVYLYQGLMWTGVLWSIARFNAGFYGEHKNYYGRNSTKNERNNDIAAQSINFGTDVRFDLSSKIWPLEKIIWPKDCRPKTWKSR